MIRSEEEVRVGKAPTERGRARLRKYVVTQQVQTTVPVTHEEVRVERESITDANIDRAMDGPALSEEEHEVILHEEQPVVEKYVHGSEVGICDRLAGKVSGRWPAGSTVPNSTAPRSPENARSRPT